MIPVPPGVRVLIATRPVDFRKGADSLAALAKERLGQDPFSGAVLVFRSRSADRVKFWYGTAAAGWGWCGNGWNRVPSNPAP